jgi:hypothetical protein
MFVGLSSIEQHTITHIFQIAYPKEIVVQLATLDLYGITPFIKSNTGEYFPSISLTFIKTSPKEIELKDPHGDIIKLTRNQVK